MFGKFGKELNLAVLAAAVFLTGSIALSVSAADNGVMRDITTQQLVKDMGLGINLGNTFESCVDEEARWVKCTGEEGQVCDWITTWLPDPQNPQPNDFETAWNSPVITKNMIAGYANAGFKTIRVPVAWSNGMKNDGNYNIMPSLLDRVQEIVDWIRDYNMYAIVNIHYDGGWWEYFPADSVNCMTRYTKMWTQIYERFKNYSDYVMFESLNEEGKWQSVWNMHNNSGNKARAYGMLNAINQKFVDIVRTSGGNNANRHLLIAGYDTNIDRTCDDAFSMPTDSKNRCAVSVHYYDPFGFSHNEDWVTWEPLRSTWGTRDDSTHLKSEISKMKNKFVNNGIPVIIGEYGFASKSYEQTANSIKPTVAEIRKYTLAVAKEIYENDMCPVLWDVQQGENPNYYYNRNTAKMTDSELENGFKAIANTPTAINGKFTSNSKTFVPQITLRNKTLRVTSPTGSAVQIRVIDMRGKTLARFNTAGSGSFSLAKISAGRFIVEAKENGRRATSAIILR
ncbi:MAG: glycoside hydrolase family 5 protein [Chitinispirillales bacterium]|jgi:endoglucanase|nr:glycoside hydrolase family 5 protein [Chitinispirillales bacterium]